MKLCKRIVSMLVVLSVVLATVGVVSADTSFGDLPSSHWSYENIQRLVKDGTINGYQDGSFRPEALVTRAEFVKMIGKTTKKYSSDFVDVTEEHWGYDYIMYSDMDVEGTSFYPDQVIKRNDVLKLLYKRSDSPKGFIVPSIITNQCDNADAAAWAYTFGIMKGDEGANLRLNDGLTRAEAAALICRSRDLNKNSTKYSFDEVVSPDLLAIVYNAFDLFDEPYNPDRTYTNGEIAEAAMRLATEQKIVTFTNIPTGMSVDRPNSFSFFTICKFVLGEDKMTEKFYDATANRLDTLAQLMFGFTYNVNKDILSSNTNNFYSDVKSVKDANENKFITTAYELGIKMENSNKLYPDKAVTGKDIAMMLVQMDAIAGINSGFKSSMYDTGDFDASLETAIMTYPQGAGKFQLILKDLPDEIYTTPFMSKNGVVNAAPKDTYVYARDYNYIYTLFLQQIASLSNQLGAKVEIVFYPSLVVDTGSGYVARVKVNVLSSSSGLKFHDVFAATPDVENIKIHRGLSFYADIDTGAYANGVTLLPDESAFTQIVLK